MSRKILVIGLDCGTPQLIFDRWRPELPHLNRLMETGYHGLLEAPIPPITVPSWMCMMTGKDPGTLGFYGFRNRKNYSYDQMMFANAAMVKEDRVWDILTRLGKKSIVVGCPQTYPPRPLDGCLIASFLTPDTSSQYTYPLELKEEIHEVAQGYIIDVDNFRTEDKENLLKQIFDMTGKRFRVVRHLMKTREWDFCMMVEMGVDRIFHGFWKFFDPEHPKYEPGSPYESSILEYHRLIDREIGEVIRTAPSDALFLVVSDHGAKGMIGGVCFNEWLIQEGYLTLKETPTEVTTPEKLGIDWKKTKAWGSGGYYGRLFMNVQGREPLGVIPEREYEKARDELKAKIEAMADPQGKLLGNKAYKPQEIYSRVRGIAPDLIVIFGNLNWRSVGSVGLHTIHTFENDTGPDDANHAQHGIFILSDLKGRERRVEGMHVMDVAPTLLRLMGIPEPQDMQGKARDFELGG